MRLKTKIGLTTLFIGFLFLSFSGINTALALDLQVPIPGGSDSITFDKTTKPIGQYIQWLYSYAISIVGIVATIMLMFGGFTWLTAGGSGEKVGKARDIIFGSLSGLVLALTSYTILAMINPDLVNFRIQEINRPITPVHTPSVNPSAATAVTNEVHGCCLTSDNCYDTNYTTCETGWKGTFSSGSCSSDKESCVTINGQDARDPSLSTLTGCCLYKPSAFTSTPWTKCEDGILNTTCKVSLFGGMMGETKFNIGATCGRDNETGDRICE